MWIFRIIERGYETVAIWLRSYFLKFSSAVKPMNERRITIQEYRVRAKVDFIKSSFPHFPLYFSLPSSLFQDNAPKSSHLDFNSSLSLP